MPVDLTKLSDEQLEAYKDIKSRKQIETQPPVIKPFVPKELQGPPVGRLEQIKQNLPVSLLDAAKRSLTPDGPQSQTAQFPNTEENPILQNAKEGFKSAVKPFMHPIDSFTDDPVGTTGAYTAPLSGISSLPKAAQETMKGAVKGGLKGGAELSGYRGFKLPASVGGAALGHFAGKTFGPEAATIGAAVGGMSPIIKGAISGGREALSKFRESKLPIGPVEAPAAATKGPSLGMLRSAVKSGSMPMEQFEAHLDKLGFDEETKGIIKNNLQTELAPKAKISPGEEAPKTLALGHLKDAAKEGLITPEEFTSKLEKMGYTEEARGTLTELLKRDIAAKAAKDSETAVVSAKKESPIKKVEFPGKGVKTVEAPKVEAPKAEETNPFLEVGPPYKPPITESQIESSQSTARTAKENQLAKHLHETFPDLSKVPRTDDFLKSVHKDANLKWKPSLRTLEEAIKKASQLRVKPIE